ncbi:ImmA/IrrE family metallo-endopeptidase [Demequina globuliformis]|uniref:ImmA/IrrE family metallo-endopeptidase n=1 Tax=Demequina globuliformis TaxID=676202 RepID=UPI000781FFCD|nr:ImmA/IrrE family metallo-endopeptidase [Demequina globuliformis]
MSVEIGERVAGLLPPTHTQREVALQIGMTPDAFSRALNGKRGFAAIELAKLADLLDADLHFLITGEANPRRVLAAARHTFDHSTKEHRLPAVEEDVPHLETIVLAYEQVHGDCPASDVPASLSAARAALGEEFVRTFADRLDGLGVDVVRLKELSAAYSMFIGDRAVIALGATGSWFWENWSLAHELGHLSYQAASMNSGGPADQHCTEPEANAFAAELLLPESVMRTVDWASITERELAEFVWDRGVSTAALGRRLSALRLAAAGHVSVWAGQPTQRLLRRHLPVPTDEDQITRRMDAASTRRFPLALQDAHLGRIAAGSVRKDTLAWMLGVDPLTLEVDEPQPSVGLSADELSEVLGL